MNKKYQDIIKILKEETKKYPPTLINQIIKIYGKDPFIILISCLLSLRSKDIVTINICHDLFKIAKTPEEILKLSQQELEKIIYKIGFYKNKAKVLLHVSKIILEKYNNIVPDKREELLKIKGIGPKTANLVLSQVFNKPEICVDTHVHRISNRLGLIKTKTPEQTEIELQKILDKKYWSIFNNLLVIWGQNICLPRNPKCLKCSINKFCKKII